MPDKVPTAKALAWPLFDAVVASAPLRGLNPWEGGRFVPDLDTLRTLLGVPLHLNAPTRSGVPALALDVWVAYELRRVGFDPDAVWPRAQPPRVIARDVLEFVRGVTPAATRNQLLERLQKGSGPGNVGGASANILGKNYLKQVDVILSGWQTGPELLVSTKRMDSSFGKNAANRVEESYGDAKNLALRHPMAAMGFLYSMRSTAYTEERRQFDWIVDLLGKLGREEDAYDACCLVVPEWDGAGPSDGGGDVEAPAPIEPDDVELEELGAETSRDAIESVIASLPKVDLRRDLVPDHLTPEAFFTTMVNHVLDSTPITMHESARHLRSAGR
ncbi:hypothetical protein ASE01_20890 [Nocardioides sp. Root190]|uniref:hypothetical protein n=1 Tax=Nocardioides sp. Root190 TaxID=1736488 RepID=UPI0006F793F7|nr:hypothetical protein [Nocardioides sp. Root190]KRB73215.1 hypothetical protein ASE01_20890 [Nocardioides sp. Root190]